MAFCFDMFWGRQLPIAQKKAFARYFNHITWSTSVSGVCSVVIDINVLEYKLRPFWFRLYIAIIEHSCLCLLIFYAQKIGKTTTTTKSFRKASKWTTTAFPQSKMKFDAML